MKTIFIVNPAAGQGAEAQALIKTLVHAHLPNTEMYITKDHEDATSFVRRYCRKAGPARFIACGGDGTFGEVLNGIMGTEGAEIGLIPIGTGNDFCRNFPMDFSDPALFCPPFGRGIKCDCIRFVTEISGKPAEGYCANMANIGFDCNVADMTARMKKHPFFSGSMAYFVSIFAMLLKKKGADLTIFLDGECVHAGKLLLTSIANGCFCGGGIKSNPLASVQDGQMNVNIIKNVSRMRFLTLLPHYMKGTHVCLKNIEDVLSTRTCREMVVLPKGGTMRLCIDGEILSVGPTRFEICPGAFTFVLPGAGKLAEKPERMCTV